MRIDFYLKFRESIDLGKPHGLAPLPHGLAPLPHGLAPLPHGLAPLPHGLAPLPLNPKFQSCTKSTSKNPISMLGSDPCSIFRDAAREIGTVAV